jgi:hypothetical protein
MVSTRMTDPPVEFVSILEASKRLNLTKMGVEVWRRKHPEFARWDETGHRWLVEWAEVSRNKLDGCVSLPQAGKILGLKRWAVRKIIRGRPELARLVPGSGPTGLKYVVDINLLIRALEQQPEKPRPPDLPSPPSRDVGEVGHAAP